jgi:ABC-type polysaccharide/polyol phosphate transport system ATPase subunit
VSTVIEAVRMTKKFPAFKNPPGFKEWVLKLPSSFRAGGRPMFTALNSVSFQVQKGECLGIIGKNGAGKSTLLSLLLGTSIPSEGTIRVEGRRTPLLELGAGFQPDLTGRENIYIAAVLLGLTRSEVNRQIDEIIAFSEIEPFMDVPVRTYSSGMYLRLAFSVAIHTLPEILLIDEILAVGDESFQKKSEQSLTRLIQSGVTAVFVSHNMDAVRKICNRVIWLDHGEVRAEGNPEEVIEKYLFEPPHV